MKTFTHLNKEQRGVFSVLLRRGFSLRHIAKEIGKSASTLSRELRRNLVRKTYDPLRAEWLARLRQKGNHRRGRLKNAEIRRTVEDWLHRKWSPEIIAGRLAREHGHHVISHEAIYQWVYAEARYLIPFLPRRHTQRRPQYIPRWKREIPDRIHVSQRPADATSRREAGHWESDLVVGPGRAALSVSVERQTRFTRLAKVHNKSAQASFNALRHIFSDIPQNLRQSVTYDNGKENSLHREINRLLGLRSYFCAPHACWEKPVVENTNGLIRWHFPKRTNFDKISPQDIQRVEHWLNSRPRKCLQFQTPAEALKLASVAFTP
jgi:IS30 family transposase